LPLVVPSEGGCSDAADPAWSETYAPGDSIGARDAISRLLARDQNQLRLAAIGARRTHIASPAEHFEQLFALYGAGAPPTVELLFANDEALLGGPAAAAA
jgi:hypothetical protein